MSMPGEKNILIIGLGLIGSSLARALHRKGGTKILAHDRNEQALSSAVNLGYVDQGFSCLSDAITQADIIVWALPVNSICSGLRENAQFFRPGQIVTDVGSVKDQIMKTAAALPEGVHFVGGHPMAGKEQAGLEASDPNLFIGRKWVLVKSTEGTDPTYSAALMDLEGLICLTGAIPVFMPSQEHDKSVALLSHLPQLVASSLMSTIGELVDELPTKYLLAAGGLQDTVRIAGSNPEIWRDICLANQEELLKLIESYDSWVHQLRDCLKAHDAQGIFTLLDHAKQKKALCI